MRRTLKRSGDLVSSALNEGKVAFDELSARERRVVLGEMEALVFRSEGDADLRDRLLLSAVPKSGLDERGRLSSVDRQGRRTVIRDVNEYASNLKRQAHR